MHYAVQRFCEMKIGFVLPFLYTLCQMSMKIAIIGAFVMNTLFGHICMMPMAYAASISMPHDEVMEMTMTPIEPMSPAHCEHCARVAKEQPSPMSAGCAGHCLSQKPESLAFTSTTSQTMQVIAVLPPANPLSLVRDNTDHKYIASTASPVLVSMTRTIVLLE